jgi:iron complex outermembrane receptor protein
VTPEFTAGGSYLLSGDGSSILRTNLSRNLKMPTLNDLFWNPGGTPGLDPEISTGAELGYSYNSVTTSGVHNSADITFHASAVKDLIQWVPGVYGYWTAENIRDVKVSGLEARLRRKIPVSRGSLAYGSNYSLTHSVVAASEILNDKTVGKQLIYTPVHHFSTDISVIYAFLNGGLRLVADSRRFTTADNSEWLQPSFRLNADIGAALPFKQTSFKIGLYADNILNTDWESVRNYPMPLRTYRIKIILTLFSQQKTSSP